MDIEFNRYNKIKQKREQEVADLVHTLSVTDSLIDDWVDENLPAGTHVWAYAWEYGEDQTQDHIQAQKVTLREMVIVTRFDSPERGSVSRPITLLAQSPDGNVRIFLTIEDIINGHYAHENMTASIVSTSGDDVETTPLVIVYADKSIIDPEKIETGFLNDI